MEARWHKNSGQMCPFIHTQIHVSVGLLHYSLLQWRHNDHDGVSNYQPHGCLLNLLFKCGSKKTSKLRVTGLCVGNSPGPVNSPHKGPVTRKMFPFDDVIMRQRTSRVSLCFRFSSIVELGLYENMVDNYAKMSTFGECIILMERERGLYGNILYNVSVMITTPCLCCSNHHRHRHRRCRRRRHRHLYHHHHHHHYHRLHVAYIDVTIYAHVPSIIC